MKVPPMRILLCYIVPWEKRCQYYLLHLKCYRRYNSHIFCHRFQVELHWHILQIYYCKIYFGLFFWGRHTDKYFDRVPQNRGTYRFLRIWVRLVYCNHLYQCNCWIYRFSCGREFLRCCCCYWWADHSDSFSKCPLVIFFNASIFFNYIAQVWCKSSVQGLQCLDIRAGIIM